MIASEKTVLILKLCWKFKKSSTLPTILYIRKFSYLEMFKTALLTRMYHTPVDYKMPQVAANHYDYDQHLAKVGWSYDFIYA